MACQFVYPIHWLSEMEVDRLKPSATSLVEWPKMSIALFSFVTKEQFRQFFQYTFDTDSLYFRSIYFDSIKSIYTELSCISTIHDRIINKSFICPQVDNV